jgi:predicted Ser/Thr protein kinase
MPPDDKNDDLKQLLRQACAELERRLLACEDCHAEEFLESLPPVLRESESALELIFAEFAIREELGQRQTLEDWYARFPRWRQRLERLFEVHRMTCESDSGGSNKTGPYHRDASPDLEAEDCWLDRYELLEKIGRGGMGVVHKARQIRLGRIVAVKMIRAGEDADPEERQRFHREAKSIAQLRHPNIVQVYAVGEQDGQPFFSMEYADGGNLAQKIAGKPLPAQQAAAWLESLARAMYYAHQQKIVHRDLKPSNVVLTADGVPKITDFGLAKWLEGAAPSTQDGTIVGTASYMAPEQAAGRVKETGPLSDVYALGAILYEMLTGRPPFHAETSLKTMQLVQTQEPVRPRTLNPKLDPELEAVCLKCLEKEPRRRYASAEALAVDLERWLRGDATLARPQRWPWRILRAMRRPPIRKVAAAFLVGFSAVIGVIAFLTIQAFFPSPTREEVQAKQREQQWQENDNALAAGQRVQIVDLTGQPPKYRWITEGDMQRAFAAPDGTFSVECWELGLLELLPDPKHSHYRFSAEVRHEEYSREEGQVGLYFAYSRSDIPRGVTHYFCELAFNDLIDYTRIPKFEGYNQLRLSAVRYPPRARRQCVLTPITPAVALSAPKPWRKLAVEMSPQEIRVFWEEKCTGKLSRDELKTYVSSSPIVNADNVKPEFAPNSPLGLYVYCGMASFRHIIVEPLGEDN